MPKIEFAIGGGAYLSAPFWLAKAFVQINAASGVTWFDTAYSYGLGKGERILGASLGPGKKVITKWGLNDVWNSDSDPKQRWKSEDFQLRSVQAGIRRALARLNNRKATYFLLHCGVELENKSHIEELASQRDAGLIGGIGYSVNNPEEIFLENSWADLIEIPFSGISRVSEFGGIVAVHGAFRQKMSDQEILPILRDLGASKVVFISGSWKPWRLLGNRLQVRRLDRAFNV